MRYQAKITVHDTCFCVCEYQAKITVHDTCSLRVTIVICVDTGICYELANRKSGSVVR